MSNYMGKCKVQGRCRVRGRCELSVYLVLGILGASTVQGMCDRSVRGANYLSDRYQVRERSTTWTSANCEGAGVAMAQVRRPCARCERT